MNPSPTGAVGEPNLSLSEVIEDLRAVAHHLTCRAEIADEFNAKTDAVRYRRQVRAVDAAHRILDIMRQFETWPEHVRVLQRAQYGGRNR